MRHFITCEYPPQSGGVSDYVYLLAKHSASQDDWIHVWCPPHAGQVEALPWVTVHPTLGRFTPRDLWRTGRELMQFPRPRRLMVHYVPQGFGYRSLNLGFCLWLWNRSWRHGDEVDLMVHEPYVRFGPYGWRWNAGAVIHRVMMFVLLRAARHVWISTPGWKSYLVPYASGRSLGFDWLPLPSNVPQADDASAVARVRERYAPAGSPLIGHFGAFASPIAAMLEEILPALAKRVQSASLLLIGGGGEEFCERLIEAHPNLKGRVHATGFFDARSPELSALIQACDLLVQPYPDGVTSRRTTVMAALSHAKAVVTNAGPATESFWRTSKAVILAPAGDTQAFVEEVRNAMETSATRTSLGTAARILYDEKFDIGRIAGLLQRQSA